MRRKRTSLCLRLLLAEVLVLALSVVGCQSAVGNAQQGVPAAESSTTVTTLTPAEEALRGLTLREKAAQVLLLTFSGKTLTDETASLLAAFPPGGLLILGPNVSDPAQMRTLTSDLQQAAALTGVPVGLFIAVDEEGGMVQRIKQGVPPLRSARTLGEESTPGAAYDLARHTAIGLRAQGINMNLAPVADVVDDKHSFLYDRTYSGDPEEVSAFVSAVVRGCQVQGLISVVKHFPGHGSASGNTHAERAISTVSAEDFESVHLVPFRAAISAGVEGVMMAHITAVAYDDENPASLSESVVEGLLRGKLDFEGLVVTDDISMAAALQSVAVPSPDTVTTSTQVTVTSPPGSSTTGLTTTTRMATTTTGLATTTTLAPEVTEKELLIAKEVRAITTALNAGCDLIILTELETTATAVLDSLIDSIERGVVSEERLDEAVLKILELKYRYEIIAPEVRRSTTTTTSEESEQ